MDPVGSVTTAQMWVATYIAAALAVALLAVAAHRVRTPLPPRLGGALLVVAVAWFGALYAWAAWSFWDTCYAAVLPAWGRMAAPAVGMLGGCLAWPFWWVSRRLLPRRPAIPFVALGALHSLPGHLSGIYQRDLLEGCALVRGVSSGFGPDLRPMGGALKSAQEVVRLRAAPCEVPSGTPQSPSSPSYSCIRFERPQDARGVVG